MSQTGHKGPGDKEFAINPEPGRLDTREVARYTPAAPAASPGLPGYPRKERRVGMERLRGGGPRVLATISLVALFGLALWFRVSSLEGMPEHIGDESFYGVQAERCLAGKPFALCTPNGNWAPFHTLFQVPLLLAFRPSLTLLRLPTAVSGIAAVILLYALGREVLGRRTALAASALLAAMPAAVVFGRIGCELGHTPLVGVLTLYIRPARARPTPARVPVPGTHHPPDEPVRGADRLGRLSRQGADGRRE